MAIHCNIENKGRVLRVATGIVTASAGVWLVAAQAPSAIFMAGLVLMASGAFMIFEGAAGWCIARHFGFRTRV